MENNSAAKQVVDPVSTQVERAPAAMIEVGRVEVVNVVVVMTDVGKGTVVDTAREVLGRTLKDLNNGPPLGTGNSYLEKNYKYAASN